MSFAFSLSRALLILKSTGSLGTKLKYQWTSWHLENGTLHIIKAKLLFLSHYLILLCWVQYVQHVINTKHWTSIHSVLTQIKIYIAVTLSELGAFLKFKPNTASEGQKHIYSHTDMWSAWDIWPDKLHTLVGTDFLMASESASVSFCVWADVCEHDVAVMPVKLLLNYITRGSSDRPD